jgi:hypothetical protein
MKLHVLQIITRIYRLLAQPSGVPRRAWLQSPRASSLTRNQLFVGKAIECVKCSEKKTNERRACRFHPKSVETSYDLGSILKGGCGPGRCANSSLGLNPKGASGRP